MPQYLSQWQTCPNNRNDSLFGKPTSPKFPRCWSLKPYNDILVAAKVIRGWSHSLGQTLHQKPDPAALYGVRKQWSSKWEELFPWMTSYRSRKSREECRRCPQIKAAVLGRYLQIVRSIISAFSINDLSGSFEDIYMYRLYSKHWWLRPCIHIWSGQKFCQLFRQY